MAEISRRRVLGLAGGAALVATVAPAGIARAAGIAGPGSQPAAPALTSDVYLPPPDPTPVDLAALFNNDAVSGANAPDGNFDGSGYTYPAEELATGTVLVGDLPFRLPGSWPAGTPNNLIPTGQQIPLPAGRYLSVELLVSAGYGPASAEVTVHYQDGSTATVGLTAPNWYSAAGPIVCSFRYGPDGAVDHSPVSIGVASLALDPGKDAVALSLPDQGQPAAGTASLHIWALTVQPAAVGRSLLLRDVRSTTNSLVDGGPQSVEATVVNAGTVWLLPADNLQVSVRAPGARTVSPARVRRLGPGEQLRVRIGIEDGDADGTPSAGSALVTSGNRSVADAPATFDLGVPGYHPTAESIGTHQAPYWFCDAKFGIFIHWGVYSVPGWAPVGQQYAEWYWAQLDDPNNPTYAHHRDTYGADFNYDDFIPMFTAEKWNPRSWVELIAASGAEYYVLTSKHHEGFALWDSKVSDRNAVKMGPKRDIIGDLFAASRRYTPKLRNGLYFSLPEWFNPDNPWLGHAPRNPYTQKSVPYTGYQAGKDFVKDYQTPQLIELIDGYDPDVIWYDIGGVNDSLAVLAEYFNRAMNRPRPKSVTFNDRGGIGQHDFTTPEYATYPNTVVAKWEASRGLDPRSYGINRETPDDAYMTAEEVVHTLVDTTSKNGNFLLDIGPNFDGTIPAIMQQRLRETGAWMGVNSESIYGTTYWSRMAELGSLRFTVKQNEAFYITSLEDPGETLTVSAPVPIRPNDRVTMLGHGRPLDWTVQGGSLRITVPAAARRAGKYAWVFRISTR
ncbi:alpha-L-fucosidase [Nakamurella lactea]|uniref:alpha-L-fucosidase n=1 Tax=Nakamurella lactea TaxID=459515 RepID=UPI000404FD0B|nr:alpha-L-fucosidase [Nakamurella lactea]